MKFLYYDCFAGISGDMHLGAMLDLGVDKDYLLEQLAKLGLSGYRLDISRQRRQEIEGTRVRVQLSDNKENRLKRSLSDIEAIILASALNENVRKQSLDMFRRLAMVEAKVHGKTVEEVHFHELGALDTIIDIVGAAICHEVLQVDKVLCGPVQVGGGYIETAHGVFPVPAPATMELLKDIPIRTGKVDFETTTPTGAVILAALVDEFDKEFEFISEKTGHGIGDRDLPIPNVLRVCLGTQCEDTLISERSMVIECNIDDMNPEIYGYLIDKFLAAGAQDVFITPIVMKKSRPATKLSVLCQQENEKHFTELLLSETTTLGLRKYVVERTTLPREEKVIQTKYGEVRIKTASLSNESVKWKAESEDCIRIANENKIPVQTVYDEINRVMLKENQ